MNKPRILLARFAPLALIALLGAATAQNVRVDGSSTVYPVSLAVAEEFAIENPDANVSVAFSGTGGGFSKFCAGETQISDASRIIKQSEIDACAANGVEFVEIPVAFDALTVVTNVENDFAWCMTVDELAGAWRAGNGVMRWSDLRAEWPDEPIEFYAPGVDSGTFDYFVEAIIGEDHDIRTDFFPSEDDNVLVQGVEGNRYAMSFFGYAYYAEEADNLNAVAIDDGAGCVEPSNEAIESGSYTPLARPLFIYLSTDAADREPVVAEFVEFYLSDYARPLIAGSGYALLDDRAYELSLERFRARATGSIFANGAGKTVLEVLRGE